MLELTPILRQAIVQDIARIARDKYIFPEKGLATAQTIQSHLEHGDYDAILSPYVFADRLTSDLRRASSDQHWSVQFNATLTSTLYDVEGTSEAELVLLKESICRQNFGIARVEHLVGNIGYVDLHGFTWIGFDGAGESIAALMQLITHCNALIFDMRRNGGGEAETLQVFISYFVEAEPVLYDSFYYRPSGETQQIWTMPYVPGKRLPDVPLYILTGGATVSGGEAFAYILQSMRRATVIGQKTLGAAHTTDLDVVQEHFQVEYPSGRSISPFTQGDWEGVGVIPDIDVPAEEALSVAHLRALEDLIQSCQDEAIQRELAWDLEIARCSYAPVRVNEALLVRYAGRYGDRTFRIIDGAFAYSRQGNPAVKLVPLAEHRFLYPDGIKFEFTLDEQGQAGSVVISYRDGRPAITLARILAASILA
ncbi:MAG TPA: S41 family peptidase [Anaerolineales bacterium]|nr:S41 family peptidase [Anaerolineales bacterium]